TVVADGERGRRESGVPGCVQRAGAERGGPVQERYTAGRRGRGGEGSRNRGAELHRLAPDARKYGRRKRGRRGGLVEQYSDLVRALIGHSHVGPAVGVPVRDGQYGGSGI